MPGSDENRSRATTMSDSPSPATRSGHRLLFPAAIGFLSLLCVLRYYPDLQAFYSVAFGDLGWPLAVDALLDDGLIPTRDFGYFYGLLALAIDRIWFAIVGRTPATVAALIALGCAFLALGLIRFARAARLSGSQRALLVACVPVAVMPLQYPTPIHAIEVALLMNALAFQARGKLSAALTLATVAAFVKPGLAYVYGLSLIVLILTGRSGVGPRWRDRAAPLLVAAAVGLAIAIPLAVWFGIGPLIDTLLPFRAMRNYGDENFGFFFGDGRHFWMPEPFHPYHYLFTPAGFWLLATLCLSLGAIRHLARLRDPAAATAATCAALHLVFVCLLFGNRWSWLYYSAILVCGLCATIPETAEGRPPARRSWMLPAFLAMLAIFGQIGPSVPAYDHWRDWRRFDATAGLYADPDEASEWQRVRDLARQGHRVMVFSNTGASFVVFPEVDSPHVWFLLRSTATPIEIERVKAQLRSATRLILPYIVDYPLYPTWPEFEGELAAFREVERMPSFRVYQRVR